MIPQPLERVPQLELDEARRTDRAYDLGEGGELGGRSAVEADIVLNRIAKIRVVPDVEEVRGEAQRLFLSQTKILDQGKIPVLLEGSAINVASEVSEGCRTSIVRVQGASDRIGYRSRIKVVAVQVTVKASVNVAGGLASGD